MKKLFRNMLAVAIAAFAFTACEDVPSPYPTPQKGQQEEIVYTGSGTKEAPYTASDAIAYAKSLNGNESDNPVYIKGIVVDVTEEFSTNFGNATFTISDNGENANIFTAYRVLYLGNKKFTANDTQIKKGDEVIVYGNVVNYKAIELFIEQLSKRFNIREIAFDRWNATQMSQDLDYMGLEVVDFGQGYKSMSPPTKELMKLVLEKRIAHGGHPVLRWMMDNIFIRTDPAGNIKADKEKSTEKIDGAVATIMALDRAIRCGLDTGESVYDTRGLLSF